MLEEFKKSSESASKKIESIIDSAIKSEFCSKVDEMAKITIAYAEAIAGGENPTNAKKVSKISYQKINLEKEVTLELKGSIDIESVLFQMQKYTTELFYEYKNNYLDVRSDLRNSFAEYERSISSVFREIKNKLNSQLKDALEIDIQTIEMQTVDIDSTLSFDVKIPDSVLDYRFQHAEYTAVSDSTWYKPWTWGDTKKVPIRDEKHQLTINPQDLEKSIEKSMEESIDSFSQEEKGNYKKAIDELRRKNSSIFQEFRINKQKEIDELKGAIENSEKELSVVGKQLENFNSLAKEQECRQ